MTIDLKAIRAAAEAATPGPWEAAGPSFGAPLPKYLNEVGRINEDEMFEEVCVSPWPEDDACSADMNYIATANPATVIALCDEIERLTACLKKANDQAEHFEREWYLRGDRLEAAEKDAARYQWLKRERVESNYEGELSIEFECGFDHWNDIDAAIDAAMKDEQK